MKSQLPKSVIILILGALTALSPFSIDMYLSAFPEIAQGLGTTVSKVSLSLSSYFVGLAVGQLIYGPLLDRFGRKNPLYVGLIIYILASVGCMLSTSIESLIAFRLIQALGGCAANVAAMAMVRDLFSVKESAKVFSLLILILGASPLLAPSAGSYIATAFGWPAVFTALMVISTVIFLVVVLYLPESHRPDASVSLRLRPIARGFAAILREPQFYAFTLAGAVAFSGLFVYVAGSPLIYMRGFGLSAKVYGWVFAGLSIGFIGASQLNIFFLKHFRNEQILRGALTIQAISGLLFVIGTLNGGLGVIATTTLLFLILASVGFANPNAAALALAPFDKNAGSAAALMGFLQMGIGACASVGVGLIESESVLPTAVILAFSGIGGLCILIFGTRHIVLKSGSHDASIVAH